MSRTVLALALSGALLAPGIPAPATAGVLGSKGWWVVLGSFSNPDLSLAHDAEIKRLRARAARCGVDPFNDFSNKFRGFSPGFDVVAAGAYKDRTTAEAVLRRARACIPGAYVKFGEHLGE